MMPISDDEIEWVEGAVESQCVMQSHSCATLQHDRILGRLLVFCESASACEELIDILLPSHQEGQRLVHLKNEYSPKELSPAVFC